MLFDCKSRITVAAVFSANGPTVSFGKAFRNSLNVSRAITGWGGGFLKVSQEEAVEYLFVFRNLFLGKQSAERRQMVGRFPRRKEGGLPAAVQ